MDPLNWKAGFPLKVMVYCLHRQYIMSPGCGHFQRSLDMLLSFDLAKICRCEERLEIRAARLVGLDQTTAREVLVQICKRSDGDDLQVGDQGCFTRIHLRDEHTLEPIGSGSGSHRQNAASMADHPIQ